MAVTKIGRWNGVPQTSQGSGLTYEPCYDVYADMSNVNANAYIRISNFCIYTSNESALTSRLPITVQITINGTNTSFVTSSTVLHNGYSANGIWMSNYVTLSSNTNIAIPHDGSTFSIRITSYHSGAGSGGYFTQSACGVYPITMTAPSSMYTGALTSATLSRNALVGGNYFSSGSYTWFPQSPDYYTTARVQDLFVDAYTKVSSATSAFSTIYFAVPNGDNLPNVASLQQNGTLTYQLNYSTSSFTGGSIVLATATAYIKTIPRDVTTIDNALKPEANSAGTVIVATPSNTQIGNKYLGGYATLTITPSFRLKYQSGSSPYVRYKIQYNNTTYYTSDSVSIQTIPQYSYNASTGEKTILLNYTDSFICTVTDQWTVYFSDANLTKYTYTTSMLGYMQPQITDFSVHRCKVDANGSYTYNGTTYSKDDYGAYCLIEYGYKFTSLDNTNVRHMTIRHSTGTSTITTSSYEGTGYMVVSASTERAYQITIRLWDTYTTDGTYATLTLSTAGVLLDFLNGGKGVAVGKVAESQNVFDINPVWKLLFYKATVGNYQNNTDQDLIAWMHDIDDRLEELENTTTAN